MNKAKRQKSKGKKQKLLLAGLMYGLNILSPCFAQYNVGNDDGFSYSCYTQDEYGIYSVGNDDGFSFSCVGSIGDEAPLPIQLLSFDATPKKDNNGKYYVRCNWSTATEINNDYFLIERSKGNDTLIFEQIGTINGAGNSSQTLYYAFNDEYPYSGLSYYRLKQVDFNGDYTYSDIRAVYWNDFDIIKLSPNPAEGEISVLLYSNETTNISTKIYNMLGQLVMEEKQTASKGTTELLINVETLNTGYYMLEVMTESGLYKVQRKLIKN